jgi:anti-sigma regulatory factor (Ser/Thr protein kinase)
MTPDMELSLPARAENIALIRHAFGALGEAVTIEQQLLDDMRLAITEACSNVVVHAYAGREPGPLLLDATLHEDELTVVVRDEGPGIAPHPGSPGLGLGLPLIASLSESVELGRDEQDRTEVRMTFSLSGAPHHSGAGEDGAQEDDWRDRHETSSVGDEDDQIDPATLT